jgi:hypothetical protein
VLRPFAFRELLLELLDASVLGCKFTLQVLDGLRADARG